MISIPPPAAPAEQRVAPGNLLLAIHHLVKARLLYTGEHQAVSTRAAAAAAAVTDLTAALDAPHARVLFADELVFVNGHILRAAHELATVGKELRDLLARAKVSELVLERGVSRESLLAFAQALADAGARPEATAALLEGRIAGVRARWVEADRAALLDPARTAAQRVLEGYATAIVLVRRAHAALAAGDLRPLGRARRLGQQIASLLATAPDLAVALAAARFPDADRARVAVSTAVLAVATARHLTLDPLVLASLASAALLADAGHLRLSDAPASRDREAASALVILLALARLDPGADARTAITHEALRLQHGPPLAGVEPLVLARVLRVVRRFNELRIPASGARGAGLDVAVEILRGASRDPASRLHLGLLVSALGFLPIGTLVQLSTGEIAAVTGAPQSSLGFGAPPVQILADAHGAPQSRKIDLAKQPAGEPARTLRRVLTPEDAAHLARAAALAGR